MNTAEGGNPSSTPDRRHTQPIRRLSPFAWAEINPWSTDPLEVDAVFVLMSQPVPDRRVGTDDPPPLEECTGTCTYEWNGFLWIDVENCTFPCECAAAIDEGDFVGQQVSFPCGGVATGGQSSSVSETSGSSTFPSSSSAPSSSSSSSCCYCDCTVTVALVPQGGTGCGIEFTGGTAYSIGGQNVGVNVTDGCDIVNSVLINGETAPAFVNDGEAISVSLTMKNGGYVCETHPPSCVQSMFMARRTSTGRMKLMLNPSLRLTRRKLRR